MWSPDQAIAGAKRGVIFDTNMLLVFLVGLWNPKRISEFKRTAGYAMKDFALLLAVVHRVGRLVTTPHILTEVCNLTNTINAQHDRSVFGVLARLQYGARERRQEASHLMAEPLFPNFGIADMSLLDASKKNHLVVTDDAKLFATIMNSGGLAINLNHLRSATWIPRFDSDN